MCVHISEFLGFRIVTERTNVDGSDTIEDFSDQEIGLLHLVVF